MVELITLLTVYYECSQLANDYQLTQAERFACTETLHQTKRRFLAEDFHDPNVPLSPEQHAEAYILFKAWEAENPELVRQLKAY